MKLIPKELLFLIGTLLWILASCKWGDWKHFRKYQASIFMMIAGDLAYGILTIEEHSYWEYMSPGIGLNHTMIDIGITFIAFPCSILLYLSRYPYSSAWYRQAGYIAVWVAVYSVCEWVASSLKLIKYDNGWSFIWSIVLNCIAFAILRLNQSKPFLASCLFIGFALFFSLYFKIPFHKLK